MVDKQTMEYHSFIQKHKFKSVVVNWMHIEPVIQSEISQKGKTIGMLTHPYMESTNGRYTPICRARMETQT